MRSNLIEKAVVQVFEGTSGIDNKLQLCNLLERFSSILAASYFTLKASSFNICWKRKKKENYHLKELCQSKRGTRIHLKQQQQLQILHKTSLKLIFFLARFCFKVSDNLAKLFLLQSLGKEWREHRIKFWNDFYDPRLSKTEIINNAPKDIAPDQWALFVEYCLKPETQTEETGKEVSSVQMWDITHMKIDGSYGLDQESEIPSPKELGSRSSRASNKEA
ncbi:hypothetical protein Ahy_B01g054462 [Arachis hypogaea]|uniref:Uncharacterized protein n=1 Tax=Arachis hypogaea TaxID=3818 RepID=A0A445ATX3_ARAHY|nr:hypothetical protein Ahy_B01g054462 [Arachis hypogaea]